MTELRLTEEQKNLIEELGVLREREGFQPAASRISSLLLVSDRTELTFDEIREALNLSKSATSNALNFLLSISMVEYITLPGDRKRYFRPKLGNWKNDLQRRLEKSLKVNALLKKVLQQRPSSTIEFNRKLEEVIDFIDFLQQEIPTLVQRWNDNRKK